MEAVILFGDPRLPHTFIQQSKTIPKNFNPGFQDFDETLLQ